MSESMLSIYYIMSFNLKTTLVDNTTLPDLQVKKWMPQLIIGEHR